MVGDEVQVRRAELADLDALCWPGAHVRQNRREKLERQARGESVVLVASLGDELVGHLEVHLSLLRDLGGIHLAWFEVKNEHRGRGVGSALLLEAERLAFDRGCIFVEIDVEKTNVAARRLYERVGFEVVTERKSKWTADLPDGNRQEVVFDSWVLRKGIGHSRE